jgi:isoleucyl-tRNA synthetase
VKLSYKGKESDDVGADKRTVVQLDTEITTQLQKECVVRDIIRLVQDHRKNQDYNVSDNIKIALSISDADIRAAVEESKDEISKETLALDLQFQDEAQWTTVKIDEHEIKIYTEVTQANV